MKCFQSWSIFVPLLLSIGYFVWSQIYTSNNYVFHQNFFERDPALSQPYIKNVYVSNTLLAILSTCVSESALVFSLVYFCFSVNKKKFMNYLIVIHCGFAITLLLNSAITNTLKVMFGSPRPNFFASCNYHGYRDAMTSGNYTEYFMLTEAGRVADTNNCLLDLNILDGFLSFPSGHSSLMFASVTYVTLVLAKHKSITTVSHNLITCLTGCLYVLASWVAISRVMDYEHTTSDVLGGCFMGFIIGRTVYKYVEIILNSIPQWYSFMHKKYDVEKTNEITKLNSVVTTI